MRNTTSIVPQKWVQTPTEHTQHQLYSIDNLAFEFGRVADLARIAQTSRDAGDIADAFLAYTALRALIVDGAF